MREGEELTGLLRLRGWRLCLVPGALAERQCQKNHALKAREPIGLTGRREEAGLKEAKGGLSAEWRAVGSFVEGLTDG